MDDATINEIVRKVLATINVGGAGGVASASGGADGSGAKAPAAPARKFITADMLRSRIGGSSRVELAANEQLTPAAMDVVTRMNLQVAQGVHVAQASAGVPAAVVANRSASAGVGASCAVGMVVDRATEKVANVLASARHDGIDVLEFSAGDCVLSNTVELCRAVAAGKIPAGVLMFPYAADAMFLAGKIAGARPVQGVSVAAVAAAMRHYNANILVLEHATASYHELRAMIRQFAACRTGVATNAALVEFVATLEQGR